MSLFIVIPVLVLPLALWILWLKTVKVIYRGPAFVLGDTAYIGPTGKHAFVNLNVPGLGLTYAELTKERVEELKGKTPVVQIEMRARLFQGPYVHWVQWEGQRKPEPGEKRFDGLFLSIFYLLVGILFMSQLAPWAAGVALIVSGFVLGNSLQIGAGPGDMPRGQLIGLWLVAGILGFVSAALFAEPSFLMFFPGMPAALGFGQILGILARVTPGIAASFGAGDSD